MSVTVKSGAARERQRSREIMAGFRCASSDESASLIRDRDVA